MRKSFTILTGIFVCALTVNAASPQTKAAAITSEIVASKRSPSALASHIAQARQMLQSAPSLAGDSVRLAVLNPQTDQLGLISVSKDQFLKKDAVLSAANSLGGNSRIEIVRANGVNTAVTVTDDSGAPLMPLLVQYPIVKNGVITEMGYYTSAHPALLSDELTSDGQTYIQNHLKEAADRLATEGVQIPADIVTIAEHLCVVEHTDHKRFMSEDQSALFPEILSLYALNGGDTFRYSVSTAGAGGMIQMIPRTYDAIRQAHANVSLNSDFVKGMRDHDNASEAMLLYMNDTWNELATHSEVQEALNSRIATKPELLAAGYNSNPVRLPVYLKNGGSNWRTLIPAETQMYLAIYSAVDTHVPFDQTKDVARNTSTAEGFVLSTPLVSSIPFLSWLSPSLLNSGAFTLLP